MNGWIEHDTVDSGPLFFSLSHTPGIIPPSYYHLLPHFPLQTQQVYSPLSDSDTRDKKMSGKWNVENGKVIRKACHP